MSNLKPIEEFLPPEGKFGINFSMAVLVNIEDGMKRVSVEPSYILKDNLITDIRITENMAFVIVEDPIQAKIMHTALVILPSAEENYLSSDALYRYFSKFEKKAASD